MIKVLIVDDHELIRQGIRKILQESNEIHILGEANSGENAVAFVREKRPDLVLMDVKMAGIGGLEATRRILRVDPTIKIIVVTACDEEPFPSRLLQAGASGYLTKGSNSKEMLLAIRRVHAGQRYISPEIAQLLALKNLEEVEESPFDKLSERELQILIMITNGLDAKEISQKLCLSAKTVHSYRYRIFEKLKVHNDVELTRLALRHGILDKTDLPDGVAGDE
ncbi:MAG: UvrY/SirA/GacA family response regulator transcription factor [Gammaproteobacteria bacterium]